MTRPLILHWYFSVLFIDTPSCGLFHLAYPWTQNKGQCLVFVNILWQQPVLTRHVWQFYTSCHVFETSWTKPENLFFLAAVITPPRLFCTRIDVSVAYLLSTGICTGAFSLLCGGTLFSVCRCETPCGSGITQLLWHHVAPISPEWINLCKDNPRPWFEIAAK